MPGESPMTLSAYHNRICLCNWASSGVSKYGTLLSGTAEILLSAPPF